MKQTLVLSISALNLLMNIFLHLALEDSSARWLVEPSGLEDMGRIDPVIVSPSHYMLLKVRAKLEFPYWNLKVKGQHCP